jgi:tetraacyldisaccharide 4'-kinase
MASVDVDEDEKIILTTEKDAMRLRGLTFLDEDIKRILYYVPIRIAFVEESDKELFNKKILAHVRNHQKNSRLH